MTNYKKEDYKRALRLASRFILASEAHKMVLDHLNSLFIDALFVEQHEELLLDTLNEITEEIKLKEMENADAREAHAPAQDPRQIELLTDQQVEQLYDGKPIDR